MKTMTVGELVDLLLKSDRSDEVRVYERGSVYDLPVSSVQKAWKGEKGKTFILTGTGRSK